MTIRIITPSVISGFCHDVDEIFTLLGFCAFLNGSFVPSLWDTLLVPSA